VWEYARLDANCVYPFGLDSVWMLSSNSLTFSNNIKMKLAVIMGIFHMTMGILHKGTNSVFFSRWADFLTEVVAGLIILLGLFGWMDFLIFCKWFTPLNLMDKTVVSYMADYPASNVTTLWYQADINNLNTPSVISMMITAVFNFGTP
jgi:vacuolar-type H+-ATPase subunit I/STV1